jgi:hypothetical protein
VKCTDLNQFPGIPQITKDKVIESLAKREDIRNVAEKIAGNDQYLSEELYSELFVALLKMKDEELIRLYENRQIGYWIIRILKNTFNSNSSSFHYKVRQGNIRKVQFDYTYELDVEDDTAVTDTREIYDQALQKSIKKLKPHLQDILKHFLELGSVKLVTEYYKKEFTEGRVLLEIKLPYIRKSVKEAKDQLKVLIENEIKGHC